MVIMAHLLHKKKIIIINSGITIIFEYSVSFAV